MIKELRKLMLEVSSACNLNCKHCYKKVKGEKSGAIMTEKIAKKALELLSPERVKIDFFGGEPLLNPELIKWVTEQNLNAEFLITTNGTICSPEIIELLKRCTVSVSLDGFFHNSIRGNNFEKVCSNIKALTNNGIEVTILSTLTTLTADGFNESFLETLRELGVKNCAVNLDITQPIQTDIRRLAKRIYELRKTEIIGIGGNWIRPIKNFVMETHSGCGVVEGTLLFVSAIGNIYDCTLSEEQLGTVENPPRVLKAKRSDCGKCDLQDLCVGGCYYDSNKLQFCEFTQIINQLLFEDLKNSR